MTSVGTVLSNPIPPYQNVPIAAFNYLPSQFFISAITLGFTTLVTATANMNYVIGQEVRLIIPPKNGCRQLNGVSGYVLSLPNPNQVLLSINSSVNVDPFITSTSKIQQPQIVAIGNVNYGQTNANGINIDLTYIPGSFINISQ